MLKAILTICLSAFLVTSKAQIVQHQISDDGYARVPLQFPFPFYGQVFTESFMFSNGVVGFLNPQQNSWCCSGFDLTTTQGSPFNYSIMPLQTDLNNYSGRFLTEGTPQYQRYVWENISEYGRPNNLNTFGVEIRPSGYIGMHYEKINISAGRPVTIGMTGNTSQGEYTQHYHGAGFIDNIGRSYITESTGNACATNPLSSPSCPNYAQAYLAQQCSANTLYDPACPNYAEAYHDYQCTLSPLYAIDCDGYAQAYLSQQCGLNPLYATTCQGYEAAYFNQQCTLNPLYNTGCAGYAQAYFDYQCAQNPLYDKTCSGYAEAYALANIVTPRVTTNIISVQVSTTGAISVEAPIVSDRVVNEVITKKPAPVAEVKTESPKPAEKKAEVSTSKEQKKEPVKSEVAKNAPTITQTVAIKTQDAPVILDSSYAKLLSKNIAIKDNARVNRLLNYKQDILHKEMTDEQWRR
jgi:hypothetical protein